MELSKAFQISADYKDCRNSANWEMLLFAEIIFIDKTHPANRPLLYQLSDQKLTLKEILDFYKFHSFSFSRDAFVLVGEVIFIDKKKKQISLSNKNTMAYKHLIVASGTKPILSFQNEELLAALQALTGALRVKPKIPDSFPPCRKGPSVLMPLRRKKTFAANNNMPPSQDEKTIKKVVHPYIMDTERKFKSCALTTFNNRFYEVQA